MNLIKVAKNVIEIEIEGLKELFHNIDDNFSMAVENILATKGRTIICGMGKSGLIGKKIVASILSHNCSNSFLLETTVSHVNSILSNRIL